MKRLFFAFLISGLALTANAQDRTDKEPVKKIEVTGSSEMEITPDEIYFAISLKEYFKDEKNQKNKVTIDVLEKQLIASITKAGIPKENLTIGEVSGYRNWTGKKKPLYFLEGKRYILKLTNLYKSDVILDGVDDRGIEYVSIDHVDHSKIKEYRKEIKIKALQAAKEKATYLLESINEKVGDVLTIQELDDQYYAPQPMMANVRMMKADEASPMEDSSIEYQKIKLSYKMKAAFRIK
ncbi:SIMPL domain-containing protein [Emticicia sp. TH156]|uniref:SIMPL domain-containing protein n=1 Tax=Emticicia sp. TH156 TaxID=2067454 RepID=UPI000C792DD4|nr:SIMPL domain-containing protein [Emticicia sp. TH156]PLK46229.1 SIMPL domain-containing protein [Emticicia sp. TH156]